MAPLTTVCVESGCRALVAGNGRCPAHRRGRSRGQDARRRAYADTTYLRNRRILLARATRCALCGRGDVPLTADHVDTVADALKAGRPVDNSLANLRPVCLKCNSRRGGARRGRVNSLADIYRSRRR